MFLSLSGYIKKIILSSKRQQSYNVQSKTNIEFGWLFVYGK